MNEVEGEGLWMKIEGLMPMRKEWGFQCGVSGKNGMTEERLDLHCCYTDINFHKQDLTRELISSANTSRRIDFQRYRASSLCS